MILRAYKYRIYPNKTQQSKIRQACGCARFVYNFFLNMRKHMYAEYSVTVGRNQCSAELTALKREPDYQWLNEADSTALQSAIDNLDAAYRKLFTKTGGYPRFKSKRDHIQSYTSKNNNNTIQLLDKHIKLPKLGMVRTRVSRPAGGRILRATITQTAAGRYFVSVLCECPDPVPYSGGNPVGIDLGLRDFAVLSDGLTHIPNQEPLAKQLKRLAHAQRSLSRKTKGSHRCVKQRIRVARLHEKVANIRKDFHQQLSTELIRKYSIIGTEDLDVKNLLADNDAFSARRISDSGWNSFVSMLEYKSVWYGRQHVRVDRYYPSSQICHDCGYQYPEVAKRRLRYWTCPSCGAKHQRDENACLNIRDEAIRLVTV